MGAGQWVSIQEAQSLAWKKQGGSCKAALILFFFFFHKSRVEGMNEGKAPALHISFPEATFKGQWAKRLRCNPATWEAETELHEQAG